MFCHLCVQECLSVLLSACLIQCSLISGYFHTLPDNAVCLVLSKAREGFMTSQTLRVAKLLGATLFCYNIIKKMVVIWRIDTAAKARWRNLKADGSVYKEDAKKMYTHFKRYLCKMCIHFFGTLCICFTADL